MRPVGPERRRRPRPHHVDLAFDLERELALDDVHHLEGALEVALVAALLVAGVHLPPPQLDVLALVGP